ncbi:MAG: hypothetical protein JXX29_12305 [Deltaproteobacteria bacterium]|nr:hypothetical protein [Deltaproteobacteria bacterium]MBN2672456.1 hypothetical protein [Deltaproteobacteria bacterium]
MQKLNHELHIQEINEHRKDDCVHYDTCLTEASALLWPSFSCKDCSNYSCSSRRMISYERACTPLAWEA